MNQTQAIAAMKKLWGSKAAWRYNDKALKGEDREAVHNSLNALSTAYTDAKAARDAKRAELLKDPEYVRLCGVAREAESAHSNAMSQWNTRRVTVGTCSNAAGLSFFSVKGEGDNWQEAIDAAKAKS